MAQLALHKGTRVGDRLIRWWTRSIYSHCELVIDGVSMSSSILDGGVRKTLIDFGNGKWDLLELPWVDAAQILAYFEATKGQPYDWFGLLGSQIFNRHDHGAKAAFCSEWCAAALGLPEPETYSPNGLADIAKFINYWKSK